MVGTVGTVGQGRKGSRASARTGRGGVGKARSRIAGHLRCHAPSFQPMPASPHAARMAADTPTAAPTPHRAASRARARAAEPGLPRARRVLLLVDVINPLDFEGAEALAPPALEAARAIARLKRRLVADGVPVVYVNDNFGHWRSDFGALVARCRHGRAAAAELVRRLAPTRRDLTLLKPRHSAFHETPLELLLTQMGARQLVVAGFATDLCVQFSAMDAFVRGYRLWVPSDCTAAETPARHRAALDWMKLALKSRTTAAGP